MQRVTVVPQLPCAESSRCCMDFCSANLQALVQMEVMLQASRARAGSRGQLLNVVLTAVWVRELVRQ